MAGETHDHIWSPSRPGEGWLAGLVRSMRTKAYRILNDEALVRRARDGDHTAFDALVARYRRRLYSMALDSLGSEDKAGEALCEMVLSAFRDIDSFGEKCRPGTWLYLHGFRAVFKRMNAPPGKYVVEVRPGATAPATD